MKKSTATAFFAGLTIGACGMWGIMDTIDDARNHPRTLDKPGVYADATPRFSGVWKQFDKHPLGRQPNIAVIIGESGPVSIVNSEPKQLNLYSAFTQAINVVPHIKYVITYKVKATDALEGTLVLTTDQNWMRQTMIERGTYDWREFRHEFDSGNQTLVDVVFFSDMPGVVEVKDIEVRKL